MGAKSRIRNTSSLRGPVSVEVLTRYGVGKPTSWAEVKFEEERQRLRRKKKQQQQQEAV